MSSEFRRNGRSGWGGLGSVTGVTVTLTVTLALALASCASGRRTVVVWEKEGASAEELEQARQACSEEPTRRHTTSVRRDRVDADAMGNAFVGCMQERGWTWKTRDLNE